MSSLKSVALRGARWALIAKIVRTLVSLGTLAIMARFLTPVEFGLLALVLAVTQVAGVVNDFGIRAALIQRETVTDDELHSVFWVHLGLATVMAALCVALAPTLTRLFGAEGLTQPLILMAPTFVLTALSGISGVLLERRFAFNLIAIAQIISAVAGAVVAIVMVLSGFKIGALIGQQLALAAALSGCTIAFAWWRPRLTFSWPALRPLIRYGYYVTLVGLVDFVGMNARRPMISRGLSLGDLGSFSLADQIIGTPVRLLGSMFRTVLFPILSSVQNDTNYIRSAYLSTIRSFMFLLVPLCMGLAAVSEPMVPVFLGSGWEQVSILLAMMSIRALFATFEGLNATIFLVKDWVRFDFYLKLINMIIMLSVLYVSLPYGIEWVVFWQMMLAVLRMPVSCYFAFRILGVRWSDFIKSAAPSFCAGLVMTAPVLGLLAWMTAPPLVELIAGVALGGVVYAAAMLAIDRKEAVRLVLQFGRMK